MHYDVIIIGGGLAGLAAGIRLAHYGYKIRIFERHKLPGGLNSYFFRGGVPVDVGLHALTNFAPAENRSAPLNKLFRQLRLRRTAFNLCPQTASQIDFPGCKLTMTNDFTVFFQEAVAAFPEDADGLAALVDKIRATEYLSPDSPFVSARGVLRDYLRSPRLIDMLCCPVMFYGNPQPHDMDFNQFCIMFSALFLEGLGRPKMGMHQVLAGLLDKLRDCGGELSLGHGIRQLHIRDQRVIGVTDDRGEQHQAEHVISTVGRRETAELCDEPPADLAAGQPGEMGFCESIFELDCHPRELGLTSCIIFRNTTSEFTFAPPIEPVDYRSQVICMPGNYQGCEDIPAANQLRLTHLASPNTWLNLDRNDYREAKQQVLERQHHLLEEFCPGLQQTIRSQELFTPKTIKRFTGHLNGAIYGNAQKLKNGDCSCPNLFLAGTDQGFLGIVGALLSGTVVVNRHFFSANPGARRR